MDAIERMIVFLVVVIIALTVYVGIQDSESKDHFRQVCVENNGLPTSNGSGLQCIQKQPARVVED